MIIQKGIVLKIVTRDCSHDIVYFEDGDGFAIRDASGLKKGHLVTVRQYKIFNRVLTTIRGREVKI